LRVVLEDKEGIQVHEMEKLGKNQIATNPLGISILGFSFRVRK
jgi:hypothetical protein